MEVEECCAHPSRTFGGKSAAAAIVWGALGRVSNYVEPFFGSGAVLLSRPRETWATADGPGTETVNDRSRFLSNFWRALRADPDAVAEACDWPVNEADLHARHRWLVAQLPALAAAMDADPEHFDAKIAGWWCWGACAWIGSGWCDEERAALRQCGAGSALDPGSSASLWVQLPHLGNAEQGLHRKLPTWATRGGVCTGNSRTLAMRGGVCTGSPRIWATRGGGLTPFRSNCPTSAAGATAASACTGPVSARASRSTSAASPRAFGAPAWPAATGRASAGTA